MNDYEKISKDCEISWIPDFQFTGEKYTQVSGYIFNTKGQLLIVRNNDTWTIPGGHPEINETQIETLHREVMEEACVTIKEIKYLGAVKVIEKGDIYYQVRYTALVDTELPFKQEWEISERKFVNLSDLQNYIKWSNGVMFSRQIEDSRRIWKS